MESKKKKMVIELWLVFDFNFRCLNIARGTLYIIGRPSSVLWCWRRVENINDEKVNADIQNKKKIKDIM